MKILDATYLIDYLDGSKPVVRLDPDSSASGTVRSKASSLRANLEHSLKEAVYNLLSWVRDNDDRGVEDPMDEIGYPLVHSTADANVQG